MDQRSRKLPRLRPRRRWPKNDGHHPVTGRTLRHPRPNHFVSKIDLSSRPFKIPTPMNSPAKPQTITLTHLSSSPPGPRPITSASPPNASSRTMGVSACAVCDGALPRFRDQPLVVVGGGDSAVEEATYLTKFASKVHLVHRRDELRACKLMAQRALAKSQDHTRSGTPSSKKSWATMKTASPACGSRTSKRISPPHLEARGMFAAIGHTPNTKFLKGQIALDEKGYIILKDGFRSTTSVEGVFAAGDSPTRSIARRSPPPAWAAKPPSTPNATSPKKESTNPLQKSLCPPVLSVVSTSCSQEPP